jgi:AcrR family transcriptional regulator
MDTTKTPRPVGRPRSETTRQAILAAAFELASEHGPSGLTMEAIGRRAGVSKETLYRWWRSKADVLLEALAERGERQIPVPDTGDFETDLRTFMRATARALDAPTRRVLRTLAAGAASDPEFADQVRDRFISRRRAALHTVLEQAVARGELTSERAAIALDLVFGSLWYRLVFGVGPLDRTWADSVAGAIAAMPPAPRSGRGRAASPGRR